MALNNPSNVKNSKPFFTIYPYILIVNVVYGNVFAFVINLSSNMDRITVYSAYNCKIVEKLVSSSGTLYLCWCMVVYVISTAYMIIFIHSIHSYGPLYEFYYS